MGLEESHLRWIVGAVGALIIVTRLYGVIAPDRVKRMAGKMAGMKSGWVRFIYTIVGLLGVWVLYSALVIIFNQIPVFLVISLLIGLLLLLAGAFIIHPEWFPHVVRGLIVDRGDFFVRFICFIGVLGGAFFLLTAIFGSSWGGGN